MAGDAEARRILIADDEINIRRVLEAILKRDGYEVVTAANGEEALARMGRGIHTVITDLKMAIARDELTGVLSRRALLDLGQRALTASLARQQPVSFLLLDLDYFKKINDRYGHAVGDAALGHFAGTVATCLTGRGTLGRIGGEEFGIVLPNHTEEAAFRLAEEIGRVVRDTPIGRFDRPIRLTVSIGLAEAVPGDTISDIMIRADMALYDAKADGRDRCTIAGRFQPDASARALAAAAAQLRTADSRSFEPRLLRDTG